LIVAPHPDDEAIGCAGTAMLHVDAGDRVCIAIATDGRRFPAMPNPGDTALKRKREAEHAAHIMQVDRLEWLGLPEGEWDISELQEPLSILLDHIRPDIVYAPSRLDFHAEHQKVAHALALALEALADLRPRVRVYQIQVPLTALLANLVSDVSSLRSRCDAVLAAYASQISSVQCTYRQRHYAAQRHGMALQAEEFWEMPARRYIRLHRVFPSHHPQAFRGMRPFPLTDPLAYLVGRRERRAIRHLELEL
jgi:LmbE family N-acetylglucosaminyl deacetylase